MPTAGTTDPNRALGPEEAADLMFAAHEQDGAWLDAFTERLDRLRGRASFVRTIEVWGLSRTEAARLFGVIQQAAGKWLRQGALYGNRRRIRGNRGRRLQRRRGELVERPFAHQYETGGLRRVWVRGHENVRKRVLIQAAGCNLGLLPRGLTGVGTPRSLQGRALSAICGLIERLLDRWGRLTGVWASTWTPAAFVGSIAHRQAA